MNAPNRAEQFVLGDGEQKIIIVEDTKIPNAATITINKEDHTLANMLRGQLLQIPSVIFAGYKVPHPLEPAVVLKVQTDGTESPVEVVRSACKQLIFTLSKLKTAFTNEVQRQQLVGDSNTNNDFGMNVSSSTTTHVAAGQSGYGGVGGYGSTYDTTANGGSSQWFDM
ncbi:DNA-directed RNA polymerase II core subunit [Microbotryomycetes sp. JL221]|nr:DNA-directed RNA polymerase II core subunit [Microbotryomycetes sp. JL221]